MVAKMYYSVEDQCNICDHLKLVQNIKRKFKVKKH